jgi:hypothetical protein
MEQIYNQWKSALKCCPCNRSAGQSAINPCPIMQTDCKQKTPVKVAQGRRKKPRKKMPRFYAFTEQALEFNQRGVRRADAIPNSNAAERSRISQSGCRKQKNAGPVASGRR